LNIVRRVWSKGWGGRLVVLVGAFAVVVAVVYQKAVWSLSRRLDAILEADRRAGLPTTIQEAYGPAVPEKDNAEGPLRTAAAIAEAIEQQSLREVYGSKGPNPRENPFRDPKCIALVGRLADTNPAFEASIAKASECPSFTFAARPEDPREVARPFSNAFACVLRTEAARALRERDAKQHDAAMQRLIRLYRLARRGYDAAPFFEWWNLVNNVIRGEVHWAINEVLISGDLDKKTRDALDEALALAENNLFSAARAHHGEKLFLLKSYQTWGQTPEVMTNWTRLGVVDLQNRIEIAGIMARFAPREASTGKSALAERRRLINEHAQALRSEVYRRLFEPAAMATLNETSSGFIPFREIALARCLRVLNALQRHNGGVADVAQLGLPTAATIDPSTEEPLKVIRTKTGWVVYSLGENQKEMAPEDVAAGHYVVGKVEELPKRGK